MLALEDERLGMGMESCNFSHNNLSSKTVNTSSNVLVRPGPLDSRFGTLSTNRSGSKMLKDIPTGNVGIVEFSRNKQISAITKMKEDNTKRAGPEIRFRHMRMRQNVGEDDFSDKEICHHK